MPLERLDKVIASMGHYSRREVKGLIREGRVLVDGAPATGPEEKVDPEQAAISVNGEDLGYRRYTYLMLHKPAGVLSATEDGRQRTVLDLLPEDLRRIGLFPVGRLDKDTEGLLLLTNDGDLGHALLSPRRHVDKVYYARLSAPADAADVAAFAAGMRLGEEICRPAGLELGDPPDQVFVTLHEGKYHQIKRMFQQRHKTVLYLKRLGMGGLSLDPGLAKGEYRHLSNEEVRNLREKVRI